MWARQDKIFLFFIPIVSYFLPPSELNLGCFSGDFSLWEYLFFFLDFFHWKQWWDLAELFDSWLNPSILMFPAFPYVLQQSS